jgi:hypothetical protein
MTTTPLITQFCQLQFIEFMVRFVPLPHAPEIPLPGAGVKGNAD